MMEQPTGGAIVNIGDWATARPYRNYAPYFASKGAIPTPTRAFAVELAPRVRVNAVLPGPVMLPDELSAEVRERAIAGTLVRRAGRPERRDFGSGGLASSPSWTGGGACRQSNSSTFGLTGFGGGGTGAG